MAQTAVEWLIEKFTDSGHLWITDKPRDMIEISQIIEQAKQIEKEQIMDAWRNGDNDSMYSPKELDQQAEQYYNETYKNK